MTKIKVRPPRNDEFLQIRNCHEESIRGLCAKDYTPEQIQAWAGRKKPRHYKIGVLRGEYFLVAVQSNRVLGVGALFKDEVVLLYVHPRCAGQGVGQALMTALEKEARKRKISALNLHSTLTAEEFYRRKRLHFY